MVVCGELVSYPITLGLNVYYFSRRLQIVHFSIPWLTENPEQSNTAPLQVGLSLLVVCCGGFLGTAWHTAVDVL